MKKIILFPFGVLIVFLILTWQIVALGKEEFPEAKIVVPGKIKDATKIEIKVEKEKAKEIQKHEVYLQRTSQNLSLYLGEASKKDEKTWEITLDPKNFPNDKYEIIAHIDTPYGIFYSEKKEIEIEKETKKKEKEEEELKKEIEETKKDIKESEDKIKQMSEETKEKISGDVVNPESKKVIEESLPEIVKNIKEESKLEKELQKNQEKKEEIEDFLAKVKSEKVKLAEMIPAPSEAPLPSPKEAEEILKKPPPPPPEKAPPLPKEAEEIIKKIINNEKIPIEKDHQKVLKETEKIIKDIQEKLPEIETKIKEKKDEILNVIKEEKKEETKKEIEALEKEVEKEAEKKVESEEKLLRDSDKDGIEDAKEIELGTVPFKADSDEDGFIDGVEIELKKDPLKPDPAPRMLVKDPRKIPPKKPEIFKVEKVEPVLIAPEKPGLLFQGKGLPESYVTLYIFSLPIVVVVRTDENGNWEYILDKPLSPGEHEVYVALQDNKGEIVGRSEGFYFTLTAGNVVRLIPEAWAMERGKKIDLRYELYTLSKEAFLLFTISLMILGIALAFFIIELAAKKKRL